MENSICQIQQWVESRLKKVVESGELDNIQVIQLTKHLSYLAFNMTLRSITTIEKPTTAAWMFHIRIRKRWILSQPTTQELTIASEMWQKATALNLLVEDEVCIRFASLPLQNYFCVLYCQSQPISGRTLHLTANEAFKEMWNGWTSLDSELGNRLIDFVSTAPQERSLAYTIKVLGYLGDAKAVAAILFHLQSQSVRVRLQCCIALGEIADESAVEPLTKLLYDPIREVRWQASKALGKLGFAAVNPLTGMLAQADTERRWRIGQSLAKIGGPAVEPLNLLLKANSELTRSNAAFILAWIRDERTVKPLITALSDSSSGIRALAAKALRTQRSVKTLDPLIRSLKDQSSEVRYWSAMSLGFLDSPKAVRPLIALLNDVVGMVRVAAADSLGRLQDKRAVIPLIKFLYKIDYASSVAATALGDLRDDCAIAPLVASLGSVGNALNVLEKFDREKVIQELLKSFQSLDKKDMEHYMYLLIAMGDTRDIRFIPTLIDALKDPRPEIRRSVPYRIAFMPDPRVTPALLEALLDEDDLVKRVALAALGRRKDGQVIPYAIQLLQHENHLVRWEAVLALKVFQDPESILPLIETLNDTDLLVREYVIEALGEFGDRRAIRALQQIQTQPENTHTINRVAAQAIKSILLRSHSSKHTGM